MKDFIIKSIVITACVSFILFCFMPQQESYVFDGKGHRYNKITGERIEYDSESSRY